MNRSGAPRPRQAVLVGGVSSAANVLSDDDVLTLARWTVLVEEHYTELRSTPTPMDNE